MYDFKEMFMAERSVTFLCFSQWQHSRKEQSSEHRALMIASQLAVLRKGIPVAPFTNMV